MECYEQAITAGASNDGLHEIDDPNYFEWWSFDLDLKNDHIVDKQTGKIEVISFAS